MNVKKNPFYYINTVVFLVLTIYSLLVCIRVFDAGNIDMNAGLCAVIVSMALCLVMYLIHATHVRNMLAANPILKTSLEVISVLIFLTLSCVVRVYMMGEFELDITREGIVLLCMFMAYLTARMLNQFGFVTLLFLVPWPYLISTYNYDMQELIQMAAVIAGICVLSVIVFAVRKKPGLRLAAIVLFLIAVAAYFFYEMYQAGLTSVYMENYKKYIECFNRMFEFTEFEKYYFIAVVMAAIISGIRLFLGSGSANTLILFVVNVLCFFTITFDLGPMYLNFMYPLLAMAASGSLGTRPSHEDEEVQLKDNLENVQVKYNKKDVVGLTYVDDSELDKMLEDIEKDQRYISHKNFSTASQGEEDNEEIPVELSMYDSALSRPDEERNDTTASVLEPAAPTPVYEPVRQTTPVPEPAAPTPVYEPVRQTTPVPEPIAPTPVYEPVRQTAPVPEPIAPTPVYEPVRQTAPVPEPAAPTPVYESVMATPAYETYETIEKQPEVSSYEPEYHYEEEKPVYEPEYRYEEEKIATEPEMQTTFRESEPAAPTPVYEPVMATPAYETYETIEKQPEVSSYEPEYHYEEEKPAYEPEYRYEEEKPTYEPEYHYEEEKTALEPEMQTTFSEPEPAAPTPVYESVMATPAYETYETIEKQPEVSSYEPEYHYEEEKPVYEPEYRYEEEKTSYEPEYHYEEEKTAAEPEVQTAFSEPAAETVISPVYETVEEKPEETKQPEVSSYEPEYHYEEEKPSYEPEYHYEEENTVTEPEMQTTFSEPEPEWKEETAAEQKQPEPVTPSYETISYQEPSYETLVKEEPQNLEPHVLIENPVSFENERSSKTSGGNGDYDFSQSKPMFETMASFFANNLQSDNVPKFEMSQQDVRSFNAFTAANEIYTPIDSLDELYANADAGLEFEEVETAGEPYNEDDELVEEPVMVHQDTIAPVVLDKPVGDEEESVTKSVVNQQAPQQTIVEPETVDLGLDLGEEFGFGQTMSFTDFYDTDNTSGFVEFEEPEEIQEMAAPEITFEMPEQEPEAKQYDEPVEMDVPVMETFAEETPVAEEPVPVMEEIPEPVKAPVMEEIPEPVKVPEETIAEQAFVQPAAEPYTENIPVQPVPAVEELPVEPVVVKKEEEPAKKVNPFAKEEDFFDWSTYDGSGLEEAEPVVEETHKEPVKPQTDNGFEEFVWTDEMIKQFAEAPKETAPQVDRIYEEEPVTEVIQEIAATKIPETVFEPTVNVSTEIPPMQQTPVETPIVQEVQREIPVQEEETPQYQVYQSSGNFRVEEPEENEEEVPQYQVYQSSGNFRIEEPEEEPEETPQYQVYQSSGSFRLEEEEEEVVPTLVTYGGPEQEKTEPVTTKPASGNKFNDLEFDLDLPDFEPFDATKR